MKVIHKLIVIFLGCLTINSCNSDDNDPGNLQIVFENIVGAEPLILSNQVYSKNGN